MGKYSFKNAKARRTFILGILALILVAGLAMGAVLLPRACGSTRATSPSGQGDGDVGEDAYGVAIHTALVEKGLPGRPGKARQVKYIVIHETANTAAGADAKSHADFLCSGGEGTTSWHYTVDQDEIYHHIPDDEVAYHASTAEGNQYGIGVELCVNSDGNFEKTFDNAAKLTAKLLRAHGLEISAVRQHADFTDKNCPMTIRDSGRWQEFLNRVQSYLDQAE
ncbi:N-acetylmuramoyl-L-alanine amidase CwlH precursor [uncultured Clostridium sp.]|nr:N-acetylmuramoyl-L-alanine amidase CwlH precursor [uncultured Clostridium sp.]